MCLLSFLEWSLVSGEVAGSIGDIVVLTFHPSIRPSIRPSIHQSIHPSIIQRPPFMYLFFSQNDLKVPIIVFVFLANVYLTQNYTEASITKYNMFFRMQFVFSVNLLSVFLRNLQEYFSTSPKLRLRSLLHILLLTFRVIQTRSVMLRSGLWGDQSIVLRTAAASLFDLQIFFFFWSISFSQ